MNILTIAILNIIIIGSYGVTLNKSCDEIIIMKKNSLKSTSISSKFEYINDNQNKIVIELDDSSLINSYEVVRPQKGDTLLEANEKMKKHRNMVMNLNYENNLRILNNNKKYVTENGSFKLFNGVTYLVEKDIEAYLNGSLVFIPINCYAI